MVQRPSIGVISATQSAAAQALLKAVADRWASRLRIAGLIEEPPTGADACSPGTLISLGDDRRFPIAQDLGCGADGCTLDSGAVIEAGQWLSARIEQGSDLVIINKFGKLEAETGGGLVAPLTLAVDRAIPVLLAVPPRFSDEWAAFAGGMSTLLDPTLPAVEQWLNQALGSDPVMPNRI